MSKALAAVVLCLGLTVPDPLTEPASTVIDNLT